MPRPAPEPHDAAYEVEELEQLRLLDGMPATPALRVLPAPRLRNPEAVALQARALAIWPGLDRRALSRCGADPRKVARLVSRRTVLEEGSIVALLVGPRQNAPR